MSRTNAERMGNEEYYPTLVTNAIEQLKSGETFSMLLLNIGNPSGGFLEIAITREQHRMDGWHGVFHGGQPDPRYCDSTVEAVAASFDAIRFDTKKLMALEEFSTLMGNNFRVKKFIDAENQFIGMSDDRIVLFHISDDWSHVRETIGQHVSLVIN